MVSSGNAAGLYSDDPNIGGDNWVSDAGNGDETITLDGGVLVRTLSVD